MVRFCLGLMVFLVIQAIPATAQHLCNDNVAQEKITDKTSQAKQNCAKVHSKKRRKYIASNVTIVRFGRQFIEQSYTPVDH